MKSYFLMYFAANILALYFLTACGSEKDSLGKAKTKTEDKSGVQCSLVSPEIPTNLQVAGGVLTWDEVVDATAYNVFVGTTQNGYCKSTTLNSVSTNSLSISSGNCAFLSAGNCGGKSANSLTLFW